MKAIIRCNEGFSWTRDLSSHPLMLKVKNKTLLENTLEFLSEKGIKEILIVKPAQSSCPIEKFAEDGTRWGLRVSYSLEQNYKSMRDVEKRNEGFLNSERYLLVDDLYFFSHENVDASFSRGREGHFKLGSEFAEYKISSIQRYFYRNRVKKLKSDFTLFSYVPMGEKGPYLGTEILVEGETRIDKLAMIGSRTVICKKALIGQDVIVGEDVVVGEGVELKNCIVTDGVAIAPNLKLENKIITATKMICIDDGETVELETFFSHTKRDRLQSGTFLEKLVAGLSFILLLVPALMLGLMNMIISRGSIITTETYGTKYEYGDLFLLNKGLNRLWMMLNCHKIKGFLGVIKGEIDLVGVSYDDFSQMSEVLSVRRAGLFSYPELLKERDQDTKLMHYRYYFANLNELGKISIFFKNMVKGL